MPVGHRSKLVPGQSVQRIDKGFRLAVDLSSGDGHDDTSCFTDGEGLRNVE
jgi:hypothetical protein